MWTKMVNMVQEAFIEGQNKRKGNSGTLFLNKSTKFRFNWNEKINLFLKHFENVFTKST
jgi:hypothetical protein